MDSMQMAQPAGQEYMREKKRGISGSTVKIVAVVTMLIDHIAAAILTRMVIARGYYVVMQSGSMTEIVSWMTENGVLFYGMMLMRLIGRLGFPIFCFLLVEGFQKTRNVGRYALRLGLFALISEIPFDLAFSGRVLEFGYQNVYFTLFLGLAALIGFDFIEKHELTKALQVLLTAAGILLLPLYVANGACRFVQNFLAGFGADYALLRTIGSLPVIFGVYLALAGVMAVVWLVYRNKKGSGKGWRMCGDMAVLAVAMALASLLRTDYGGMGVLTIAVMYLLRRRKVLSMTGGCVTLTVMSLSEVTSFFALIPIALYNGERGLRMKYFFYVFYPAHLFIIWLICLAMGLGWMSAI